MPDLPRCLLPASGGGKGSETTFARLFPEVKGRDSLLLRARPWDTRRMLLPGRCGGRAIRAPPTCRCVPGGATWRAAVSPVGSPGGDSVGSTFQVAGFCVRWSFTLVGQRLRVTAVWFLPPSLPLVSELAFPGRCAPAPESGRAKTKEAVCSRASWEEEVQRRLVSSRVSPGKGRGVFRRKSSVLLTKERAAAPPSGREVGRTAKAARPRRQPGPPEDTCAACVRQGQNPSVRSARRNAFLFTSGSVGGCATRRADVRALALRSVF